MATRKFKRPPAALLPSLLLGADLEGHRAALKPSSSFHYPPGLGPTTQATLRVHHGENEDDIQRVRARRRAERVSAASTWRTQSQGRRAMWTDGHGQHTGMEGSGQAPRPKGQRGC